MDMAGHSEDRADRFYLSYGMVTSLRRLRRFSAGLTRPASRVGTSPGTRLSGIRPSGIVLTR